MDLKRLVSHFTYHIEPKPEGGFIARPSDPSVAPLEAPTREELQKKIQENIFTGLATAFPALKIPTDGTQQQFAFHVERTPQGGFSIHSADPNDVLHVGTEKEFETRFLEKILGFAGNRLMPQLAQAIASQGASGNIKVVVNRKTSFQLNPGSHKITLGLTKTLQPTSEGSSATTIPPNDATLATPALNNTSGTIDNSPITPEPSNFGKFLRFVPALLLIAALLYFVFLRQR